MSSQRVVRFPREDGDFILVHISARGEKPLDVDLKATEGENPYFVSVHQDKVSALKSSSGNIEDAEWSAAVSWALLRIKPPAAYQQLIEQLEVVASIEKQQKLVLKFRENIEDGLKPRIGSITLTLDENQEVNLFEWAGMLAADALAYEETTQQLSEQVALQKASVDVLQDQLHEFIKRKSQNEDQLLEKFRQLLNTKKLKIRDQQRLLAGASVDRSAAEGVRSARQSGARANGASRGSSKRKAQASTNDGDGETRDDAGIKDEAATESEEDFEAMNSPQRSDSEEPETTGVEASSATIPPFTARDLPFASKQAEASTATESPSKIVEDDDETDDEL